MFYQLVDIQKRTEKTQHFIPTVLLLFVFCFFFEKSQDLDSRESMLFLTLVSNS